MPLQRGDQSWHCLCINPREQFFRRRSSENFIEEDREACIGHDVQPERRLPHFPDPLAQRRRMLRAEIRVQRERHLQLVNRLRRQPREEDSVQPLERVVIPLQPPHALPDRQPRLLRLGESRQAGERRQFGQRRKSRRIHEASMGHRTHRASASGVSFRYSVPASRPMRLAIAARGEMVPSRRARIWVTIGVSMPWRWATSWAL